MKESLLAAGGVVSAVAASTCCIVPLALVSVGVSGVWIGKLTALAPYQPIFIATAIACLGAGFWLVYRRIPKKCETEGCADARSDHLIKSVLLVKGILWLSATLVTLSLGVDYGAHLFL